MNYEQNGNFFPDEQTSADLERQQIIDVAVELESLQAATMEELAPLTGWAAHADSGSEDRQNILRHLQARLDAYHATH